METVSRAACLLSNTNPGDHNAPLLEQGCRGDRPRNVVGGLGFALDDRFHVGECKAAVFINTQDPGPRIENLYRLRAGLNLHRQVIGHGR